MKKTFQIVYPASGSEENEIHQRFYTEAKAMQEAGIVVGPEPLCDQEKLMYRGFTIYSKDNYPADSRYINNYEGNANYLYLSRYYPKIADISIETFFVGELDKTVPDLIRQKGWSKAFIKKDIVALEHIEEGKSVWPVTPIEEMKSLYDEYKFKAIYAIRKYVDPEILEKELRYWIFNGRIYRRDNIIPDVVKEAASRLNKLGSKYYTIDATTEFIVEVNPGESSDRHAENSAELFANWIKKEFVD